MAALPLFHKLLGQNALCFHLSVAPDVGFKKKIRNVVMSQGRVRVCEVGLSRHQLKMPGMEDTLYLPFQGFPRVT